jgi:hypothetical protein
MHFYLDDAAMAGAPIRIENREPNDLAGSPQGCRCCNRLVSFRFCFVVCF